MRKRDGIKPSKRSVKLHQVNHFTPLPSREGLGEGGDTRLSWIAQTPTPPQSPPARGGGFSPTSHRCLITPLLGQSCYPPPFKGGVGGGWGHAIVMDRPNANPPPARRGGTARSKRFDSRTAKAIRLPHGQSHGPPNRSSRNSTEISTHTSEPPASACANSRSK